MNTEKILETIAELNSAVNNFIWTKLGIWLLLGAGLLLSVCTGFFQLTRINVWWKCTVCALFKRKKGDKKQNGEKSISQFQALCTALAATIGTGNIAGVSAAIVLGGPGAVFWIWVAAFFGMATSFAENTLGIFYRRRSPSGAWAGGAMYYLRYGLGEKKNCRALGGILAALFAGFTILASFGIGNLGQVNKITVNLEAAFFSSVDLGKIGGIPVLSLIIGVVLTLLAGLIILGGLKRIAAFAELVVPFMAVTYIAGALTVCIINFDMLAPAFCSIFRFALSGKAAAGGAAGAALRKTVTQGCTRGMFSNEAGLGSSVMVHSSSDVHEPVQQGMWGIFQVFFDTIIVCTMTAMVVLTSGAIDLKTGTAAPGTDDATLVAASFGKLFGFWGEAFVAAAVLLFAFTTVIGWSQYGSVAAEYLFGKRAAGIYRIVFVVLTVTGAVMTSSLAWDISDTFNGLMMLPNLIGIITLCPVVIKLTKNYTARKIRGVTQRPLLSNYEEIQIEEQTELEKELYATV